MSEERDNLFARIQVAKSDLAKALTRGNKREIEEKRRYVP